MIARLYRSGPAGNGLSDAKALDSLIDDNKGHSVCLDSDRIILVEPNLSGPVVGALIWRPAGFIHELVVSRSNVARRSAASALVTYAVAEARFRQYDIRSGLFLVDPSNISMLRFARELGAVEQPGTIFTFDF